MERTPKNRFSAAARDYHRHRPSYPDGIVDWLVERSGIDIGDRIADIGCGTGIFSRILEGRGFNVVGVDPNEAMLDFARSPGTVRYMRGEAEALGLRSGVFDLAVSAQAFHWFDVEPALWEMERIAKPSGCGAAIWNCRADIPVVREYDALIAKHSSEYLGEGAWRGAAAKVACAAGRWNPETARFPNHQFLNEEGLLGRAHSASYVAHGIARLDRFDAELRELFHRHEKGGTVRFEYQTLGVWWRFP